MREIRGDAKNIRTLLGGGKFAIDYYQREFRWEKKQVAELINDLADKFLESHESGNERSAVAMAPTSFTRGAHPCFSEPSSRHGAKMVLARANTCTAKLEP